MEPKLFVDQLQRTQDFFNRSTSVLKEEDSAFAPVEGMFTVSQLVAHVAQTIDWFVDGAFRPEGFDTDFEKLDGAARAIGSLKEAREWLDRSFHSARETIGAKTADELMVALPEGPIMGGAPRMAVFGAIEEHSAHHRGALAVYSRLRGYTPPMPYGDF